MRKNRFWGLGRAAILAIVSLFIILEASRTEAQINPELIIEMSGFTNYLWSADSQAFVFQDDLETGVNTDLNTWYRYDVRSGSLNQFANWPLQPELTEAQIQTFQIARDLEGYLSFVYLSPNGRYIVYKTALPAGNEALYTAAIGDLQTNTYRQLLPIAFNSLNHIGLQFKVIWSGDSNSFILQNLTSFGGEIRNYYISGFQAGLDSLTLLDYTLVNIAGTELKADESHDISHNGQYILFESSSANLTLWDYANPSNSRTILASQIDTAIFTPDEAYVLFLGNEGWMAYELATGIFTQLSAATHSRLAEYAAISPDGRYLAWVEGEIDDYSVYILEQNQIVSGDFVLSNFTILAQEGLLLQQGVILDNGDIGVNTAGESPFLSGNSTLTVSQGVQFMDLNSQIYADSIHLNQDTQVYNLAYNVLTGVGQAQGEITTPLELPLLESLPPVPEITVGTSNITVRRNSSSILGANSYGSLSVDTGGTVTFTGGVYHFSSWDLGQDARILYAAPTEIRIAQTLNAQQGIRITPSPQASTVDASDIMITVLGTGSTGNPSQPSAAQFGNNGVILANIYVPNGTLEIGNQSAAQGAFIGRYVIIGNGSRLALDSGF